MKSLRNYKELWELWEKVNAPRLMNAPSFLTMFLEPNFRIHVFTCVYIWWKASENKKNKNKNKSKGSKSKSLVISVLKYEKFPIFITYSCDSFYAELLYAVSFITASLCYNYTTRTILLKDLNFSWIQNQKINFVELLK